MAPPEQLAATSLDRRGTLKLAALGLAGLFAPVLAMPQDGFTHGVASGEPGDHSVTLPGAKGSLPWIDPDRLAADTVALNPGLKWCDTARRGYMAVELTPARSTCEWRFLDTVRQRSTRLTAGHTMAVDAGRNRFT